MNPVTYDLSYIEGLEKEIERLRELFALKWDATQSAETEAMKADNERLRAALQQIAIEDPKTDSVDLFQDIARIALEGKP